MWQTEITVVPALVGTITGTVSAARSRARRTPPGGCTLAASLAARDAITRPRTPFAVPARSCARRPTAVDAVYAMDTAVEDTARTSEQLTTRRLAAKAAIQQLETAMAAVMAELGAGLPARHRMVTSR